MTHMTSVQRLDRFVITGGAGFIGSHMVCYLLDEYPECQVVCIDCLNYSSEFLLKNLSSVVDLPRFEFVKMDLATEYTALERIIFGDKIASSDSWVTILHFAAESCVDRSFVDPLFFTKNNILAIQNVLEAYRQHIHKNPERREQVLLVNISTDEVYGEQGEQETVLEDSLLKPTNPYAATKAACDLIVYSYIKSFGLRVTTSRANNVYGPRQYPEKLVAVALESLKNVVSIGKLPDSNKIKIHGDGSNKRSYLHVKDFVRAVDLIRTTSETSNRFGEVYNVGVIQEITNRSLIRLICTTYMRERFGIDDYNEANFVEFTKNRCYNDSRYSLDIEKITKLGWSATISLHEGILELVREIIPDKRHDTYYS